MFNSVLLVYLLVSPQVIFCFGLSTAGASRPAFSDVKPLRDEKAYDPPKTTGDGTRTSQAPATTRVEGPPRDDVTLGLSCQTLLLYLEIVCGALILTLVAESTALLICYRRRRRQKVTGKKADSCTETDNYQEYEENGSDYETLSNDYKPIPPPLETIPKVRRLPTKVLPMCEIQHTPKQTTEPYQGESRSLERPSSQTLPLPVRRHRMLPPASHRPVPPPTPPSQMLPLVPPNRTQAQVPRNPLLPVAPNSPMLPQAERNPRVLVPCSPPQFRLPPQPLHLPLLPQSQSLAPGKLHLPVPILQAPPASSKHCHPTRPPAPLPKNISSHDEMSTSKTTGVPPSQSHYNTDTSDDEWTIETIYY